MLSLIEFDLKNPSQTLKKFDYIAEKIRLQNTHAFYEIIYTICLYTPNGYFSHTNEQILVDYVTDATTITPNQFVDYFSDHQNSILFWYLAACILSYPSIIQPVIPEAYSILDTTQVTHLTDDFAQFRKSQKGNLFIDLSPAINIHISKVFNFMVHAIQTDWFFQNVNKRYSVKQENYDNNSHIASIILNPEFDDLFIDFIRQNLPTSTIKTEEVYFKYIPEVRRTFQIFINHKNSIDGYKESISN